MSEGIVFMDGEFMRPKDAKMSIFDVGFIWGDSVYDVTSTWNGWFFMLDEHLERFQRSCEGFRLQNPYSFQEMRRICAECVDRSGLSNAYVKMQITRGVPASRVLDWRTMKPCVVVFAIPYEWIWGEEKCRNGASLFVSGVERVSSRAIDQRYKNYNRADLVQARLEAYDHECDDAILIGPDGFVTEGPGFNFFIIKDGIVTSPDYNVLEGITRRAVLEICEQEKVPFELRKVRPEELAEASEVFASTTAGGVMPITSMNGKPVGNGHAGIITSRIQSMYWSKREAGWHGVRAGDILEEADTDALLSAGY